MAFIIQQVDYKAGNQTV